MKWSLYAFLTISSLYGLDQSAEDFLNSLAKPPAEEALSFLEQTPIPTDKTQKKCTFHSPLSELSPFHLQKNSKLLVFTSFSLPLESWKEFSHVLQKTGGSFVLRGLPENSFPLLAKKIIELKKAGIQAEILLDPESFEKYAINAIPSAVLENGKCHDKIAGNIKLSVTLALFAESGNTQALAQELLILAEAP
jgi:type-F conjugative transfer system pilin assembly protein TrbC